MKCENICSMHNGPANFILKLIAGIILIYGLWFHSIKGILIAVLVALIGHIIQGVSERNMPYRRIKSQSKRFTKMKGRGNICGIIGLCLFWIPIVGFILGLISLSRKEDNPALGILSIILSVITFAVAITVMVGKI